LLLWAGGRSLRAEQAGIAASALELDEEEFEELATLYS
jgi:hypothetical protein